MCYIDNRKGENNRPQGVDLLQNGYRITTLLLVKVLGWFSMLKTLLDKRKYECQQCQDEHSKSHKVFKIKWFLVHQHHLPFYVRIEVIHPATRLLRNSFYHNTLCVFKFFFMAIPHSNASAIYFSAPSSPYCIRSLISHVLSPRLSAPYRN